MRLVWLSLCALIGYIVGTINPSYIIAKAKKFDIRKDGSGNAGGSNALITMGKKIGALCMIFDIVKAFIVVKLSMILLPNEILAGAVSTAAVILGHIFPLWMGFKGGKGLACLGGSLLAYSPVIGLIFLAIEFVLALIVDYICVVPITASVAFPVVYYLRGGNIYGALLLGVAAVAMLYRHRENLARIKAGKEAHFSYLWKSDKEKERIKANIGDDAYDQLQIKKFDEK